MNTETATEERPDIAGGFDPDAGQDEETNGAAAAADPDPTPEPEPAKGANAGTYVVLFVPEGETGYKVMGDAETNEPKRFTGSRRQVMEAAFEQLKEAEAAYPGMLLSPVPAGSWKPKPVAPASGLKIG